MTKTGKRLLGAAKEAVAMARGETHTPGPWNGSVDDNGKNLQINGPNDEAVVLGCGCCGSPWTDKQHAQGNLRLFLAAPEMKAALKPLAFCADDLPPPGVSVDDWRGAVHAARAALAKAEGRSS